MNQSLLASVGSNGSGGDGGPSPFVTEFVVSKPRGVSINGDDTAPAAGTAGAGGKPSGSSGAAVAPECLWTRELAVTLVLLYWVMPLGYTFLLTLIPLSAGVSHPMTYSGNGSDQVVDRVANYYMVALFLLGYLMWCISTFVFFNQNFTRQWQAKRDGLVFLPTIAAAIVLCLVLVAACTANAGDEMSSIPVEAVDYLGLAATAGLGAVLPLYSLWCAWREYTLVRADTATHVKSGRMTETEAASAVRDAHGVFESRRRIAGASFAGQAFTGVLWLSLQYLSFEFAHRDSGAQGLWVLVFFSAGYTLLMMAMDGVLLQWFGHQDAGTRQIWAVFRFGSTCIYYTYYRELFLSVEEWGNFCLYQGLHLLTELWPVVQLSEAYVSWRHRLLDALGIKRAFRITDRGRYRVKTVRVLLIKEQARLLSIVAIGLFLPFVRAYANHMYYPKYESLPNQLLNFLVVMLVLELALFGAIVFIVRRWYGIHVTHELARFMHSSNATSQPHINPHSRRAAHAATQRVLSARGAAEDHGDAEPIVTRPHALSIAGDKSASAPDTAFAVTDDSRGSRTLVLPSPMIRRAPGGVGGIGLSDELDINAEEAASSDDVWGTGVWHFRLALAMFAVHTTTDPYFSLLTATSYSTVSPF